MGTQFAFQTSSRSSVTLNLDSYSNFTKFACVGWVFWFFDTLNWYSWYSYTVYIFYHVCNFPNFVLHDVFRMIFRFWSVYLSDVQCELIDLKLLHKVLSIRLYPMIMLSHFVCVKKNLNGKIQCNPDVRGPERPDNNRPNSLLCWWNLYLPQCRQYVTIIILVIITAPTTAEDFVKMDCQGPGPNEIKMSLCLTAFRSVIFKSWFFMKTMLQIWQLSMKTLLQS